jgi:phosphoglycerate kinase
MKRTVATLEGQPLEGQRAFVRVDFNVPLDKGEVADATRIVASLPTIRWLKDRGCRVILASHLGRPKGRPKPEYSLRPVVPVLERELGAPVQFLDDPLSEDAPHRSRRLRRGEVMLLENTRFHPGEEQNDPQLAEAFAQLGDLCVNDAFGTAQRAHASTEGVARVLEPGAGPPLRGRAGRRQDLGQDRRDRGTAPHG